MNRYRLLKGEELANAYDQKNEEQFGRKISEETERVNISFVDLQNLCPIAKQVSDC